jgi:hypothetical protein
MVTHKKYRNLTCKKKIVTRDFWLFFEKPFVKITNRLLSRNPNSLNALISAWTKTPLKTRIETQGGNTSEDNRMIFLANDIFVHDVLHGKVSPTILITAYRPSTDNWDDNFTRRKRWIPEYLKQLFHNCWSFSAKKKSTNATGKAIFNVLAGHDNALAVSNESYRVSHKHTELPRRHGRLVWQNPET